ncbi:hypothetical protein [Streptomyces sp. NPDC059816]|uniref:hypothetical protein n=1 Tax=Streptomyces sp. NPDC059816 TaxID=3346960 RepID=UPI00365CAA55
MPWTRPPRAATAVSIASVTDEVGTWSAIGRRSGAGGAALSAIVVRFFLRR